MAKKKAAKKTVAKKLTKTSKKAQTGAIKTLINEVAETVKSVVGNGKAKKK
jgi:hypothetical protein